jgi:hypothetical protein
MYFFLNLLNQNRKDILARLEATRRAINILSQSLMETN